MKLPHRLRLPIWLRRPPVAGRSRRKTPLAQADNDAPPRGCGWFDSSHDLRSGLSVFEVAGAPGADAGPGLPAPAPASACC